MHIHNHGLVRHPNGLRGNIRRNQNEDRMDVDWQPNDQLNDRDRENLELEGLEIVPLRRQVAAQIEVNRPVIENVRLEIDRMDVD